MQSSQSCEPASIQGPSQRHLVRTKDTPITQEIPGVLGAVSRKGSTTTEHNKRCSRHCHHFGSDQLRAGNRGPRPTNLFSTVLRGDGQTQTHKGEKSVRRWRQRLARRDDKRRNTTHCCPQWELHGAGRTLPCGPQGSGTMGARGGNRFLLFSATWSVAIVTQPWDTNALLKPAFSDVIYLCSHNWTKK